MKQALTIAIETQVVFDFDVTPGQLQTFDNPYYPAEIVKKTWKANYKVIIKTLEDAIDSDEKGINTELLESAKRQREEARSL